MIISKEYFFGSVEILIVVLPSCRQLLNFDTSVWKANLPKTLQNRFVSFPYILRDPAHFNELRATILK